MTHSECYAKYFISILVFLAILVILGGCVAQKPPAVTFRVEETDLASDDFVHHPTSRITVKPGTILQLRADGGIAGQLDPETIGAYKGSVSQREVLFYAKIYKNGDFVGYTKITNVAEGMTAGQPFTITNPSFFTETINDTYKIVLKGYEIDTKALAEYWRRAENSDPSSIEPTFAPGATFATGIKSILVGASDVLFSFTGRRVDDWILRFGADHFIEHSFYIIPDSQAAEAPTGPTNLPLKALVLIGEQKLDGASPDDSDTKIYSKTMDRFRMKMNALATAIRTEGHSDLLQKLQTGEYQFLRGLPYVVVSVRQPE